MLAILDALPKPRQAAVLRLRYGLDRAAAAAAPGRGRGAGEVSFAVVGQLLGTSRPNAQLQHHAALEEARWVAAALGFPAPRPAH